MVRLVIASALLLSACGGPPADDPPFTETTTTAAPVTATRPPTTRPQAKTCTVPSVVGMVHQTAQDTMQASGLYVLLEQDATGQGRLLINDRNWITTGQTPAAGEVVDCATEVMLSAKKIGE